MTIAELYKESILHNHKSLILLIDFLVLEKKLVSLSDPDEKINYYLQTKWRDYLNKHLAAYAAKRGDLFK
jgi:hypothetical protein